MTAHDVFKGDGNAGSGLVPLCAPEKIWASAPPASGHDTDDGF